MKRWNEAGEWLLAFTLSLVLNLLAVLAFVGWMEIERQSRPEPVEAVPEEVVALIRPEDLQVVEEKAAVPEAERPRGHARTSPEQASTPPEQARYLGQRDTRGASERDPVPGALEVPSQSGVEPRREGEIETTESRYQDGTLEHDRVATKDSAMPQPPAPVSPPPPEPPPEPAAAMPADPAMAATAKPGESPQTAKAEEADPGEPGSMPETPKLLEGPNTVERPPLPPDNEQAPKETPPTRSEEGAKNASSKDLTVRTPPPRPEADPKEPGFRGFQQKTRIKGSISRRGVAALDVADSALGRYYEVVSRAVEREWQRNCVRYRDHITPGWITVRFVITERGEVRSIGFVEVVEVGEIQKGFTLNAIRHAELPKMPDAVKRELDGEPLELIYNFYF